MKGAILKQGLYHYRFVRLRRAGGDMVMIQKSGANVNAHKGEKSPLFVDWRGAGHPCRPLVRQGCPALYILSAITDSVVWAGDSLVNRRTYTLARGPVNGLFCGRLPGDSEAVYGQRVYVNSALPNTLATSSAASGSRFSSGSLLGLNHSATASAQYSASFVAAYSPFHKPAAIAF